MSGQFHGIGHLMTPEEAARLRTVPIGEIMPWVWYSDPNGLGPDLLIGRKPDYMLPIGRQASVNEQTKLVYVETSGDRRVVEEALEQPLPIRDGVVRFDLSVDRPNARPSQRPRSRSTTVVLYEPPGDGWPWVIVVCMPFNLPDEDWGRQRYAVDAFATEQDALDHMAKMARSQLRAGIAAQFIHPKDR